ncbi:hypothetical protein CEXT_99301 [Caerostris extrusa]|uniref:Uncharacterized protein n=1 Tax=Caerostris extrusa TaxID=172846 RepID=A0AAV4XHW6_CAEEX|nr:hypothetical protein CEXT_99301 [Caerostris extrusa]
MPPVQRTSSPETQRVPSRHFAAIRGVDLLNTFYRCLGEYMENEVLPALPGALQQKNVLRYFPVGAFPHEEGTWDTNIHGTFFLFFQKWPDFLACSI